MKTCPCCGQGLPDVKSYRVKWEIDVDASTPLEAAKKARELQIHEGSWANVFEVSCEQTVCGEPIWTRVDLMDIENADGPTYPDAYDMYDPEG